MGKLFGRYETLTIDFDNFSWHLEGGWGGNFVPPALSGNFINNINIDKQSISFVDSKDGNVLVNLTFSRGLSFYLEHDEDDQVYGTMSFQNISLYTPWQDGHFVEWEDYKYETETQFDQINDFLKNIKEINKGYVHGSVSHDYDATIYRYTHISYVEIRTGCSTREELTAYMFDDRQQALIRITNIGSCMDHPYMIQICIKFDENGKISELNQEGPLQNLKKDNPADKLVCFIQRLKSERKNN
jgi:hypothetical protein